MTADESIIAAFVLTVIAEEAVLAAIMVPRHRMTFRLAGECLVINGVTNPLLNTVILGVPVRAPAAVLLMEAAVVLGKAGLYRALEGYGRKECFLLSLLLNGCSGLLGLLIK